MPSSPGQRPLFRNILDMRSPQRYSRNSASSGSIETYLAIETNCVLHLSIDGNQHTTWPLENVPWTTSQAWNQLQKTSRAWYERACGFQLSEADWDDSFRNRTILQSGHFVIYEKDVFRSTPGTLMSEEDARYSLFRDILSCVAMIMPETLRIEVFWDFYRPTKIPEGLENVTNFVQTVLSYELLENFEKREYVPREHVRRLFSRGITERLIKSNCEMGENEKQELLNRIFPRSVILFAVCIWGKISLPTLKRLLDHNKKVSDFNPWLVLEADNQVVSRQDRSFFKDLLPKFFHHKFAVVEGIIAPDGATDAKTLRRGEVVPVHHHGDSEKVLGSGIFSDVFEVRIHPCGHEFSADKHEVFALKQFKGRYQHYQGKENDEKFRQETQALEMIQKFRKKPHAHIVRYWAAWTQDSNFYILFELASTNLQTFLDPDFHKLPQSSSLLTRSVPKVPGSNRPRIDIYFQQWILLQVAGLADALAYVHQITASTFDGETRRMSHSNDRGDENPGQHYKAVGFHHDIKLDNILVCDDGGENGFGTLKLGDFGSARVKTLRLSQFYAASRTPQKTEEEDGAITYQSPDLELNGHASRKADVWSLGCVFLELLLWCFDDTFTVLEFSRKRLEDEKKGPSACNRFWQRTGTASTSNASLKPCVVDRLKYLREHATHTRPFRVWLECVERMLEVKDSNRLRADELLDRLLENLDRQDEEDDG